MKQGADRALRALGGFRVVVGAFLVSASLSGTLNGAEVQFNTSILQDATAEYGAGPTAVFVNSNTGYVFFVRGADDNVVYVKTEDGGDTWTSENPIGDDQDTSNISVWFDQWTPGDAGTKIHLAHIGAGGTLNPDDLMYNYLDTADDSVGSWVKVNSAVEGTKWDASADGAPTITKTTEGRLFAWVAGAFTTDRGFAAHSTDNGATWTEDTPAGSDDDADFAQLLPLSGGDVLMILHDTTANAVQSKVWDAGTTSWDGSWESLDSWVELAAYDATFGAALLVHNSTTNIYMAGHTAPSYAVLTGELRSYRYRDATRTWDAPSIIVDDNEAAISEGSMFVDNDTGDIYAAYIRGNLDWNSFLYYRKSTDGGLTWSEESSRINSVGDDLKNITGSLGINKMYAVWYNDDLNSVHGNKMFSLNASPTPSGPTEIVTNSPAVGDIGTTNAIVYGIVRGAEPEAQVLVYWGETDGVMNPSAWDNTNVLSTVIETNGYFSTKLNGLSANTTYFFRFFATNVHDHAWSADSYTFTTVDAALADVLMEDSVGTGAEMWSAGPNVVFVDDQTGYAVYEDLTTYAVKFVKTTDGGVTWSTGADIGSVNDQNQGSIVLWYDRWTPGDVTGTKIHVINAGSLDDDLQYTYIDSFDDSFGTWVNINTSAGVDGTLYAATQSGVALTKGADGVLYAGANGTFGGVANTLFLARSTDGGANWTSIGPPSGTPASANADTIQLLPLTTDSDVLLIQQDNSTRVMRSAVWDAVGLTWDSWTTIDTWLNINAAYNMPWGASVNIANGDIYLIGHTAPGWAGTQTGTGELKAYRFTEGSRTWSTLSNVSDDPDGYIGAATLVIDQNTGNLYAIYTYGEQSVGNNHVQTMVNISYRVSTDGGATWGERIRLNTEYDDDFEVVRANFMSDDRLYCVFFDADANDMRGVTVADLISAGGYPPIIANETASGITETDATLNGTLTSEGYLPTTVSVYWGPADGADSASLWGATNTLPGNPGDATPLSTNLISQLLPDTAYFYRYYATNSAGEAWATNSTAFRTQGPPHINNERGATNITAHAVELFGQVTSADPTATVTYYWGKSDGGTTYSAWDHTNSFTLAGTSGTFSTNLPNWLDPDTEYWYTCYATNALGYEWASAIEKFTTDVATASAVLIDGDIQDATAEYNPGASVVFVSDGRGYVFYVDGPAGAGGDVVYRRTDDGGRTWGDPVIIDGGDDQDSGGVGIWYDRWTPGDTGTKIHIVHIGPTGSYLDELHYNYLDTADESVGTWQLVFDDSAWGGTGNGAPSITKSSTGRLGVYVGANLIAGRFSWSDDGVNWTQDTPFADTASTDFGQMLPLDSGDMILLHQDISANTFRAAIYSNDNTWVGWTDIDTGWTEYNPYDMTWSGTLDPGSGDIYVIGHTQPNNAAGILRSYRFDAATRTWSTQTDVLADTGAQITAVNLLIDHQSGDLYALYSRNTSAVGSNPADVSVYSRRSTDGGTTWGEESAAITAASGDIRAVRGNFGSPDRLYAAWYEEDNNELYGNTLVDIASYTLAINDVTVVEADAGSTNAHFVVTLSAPAPEPVTVCYTTADGTAREGFEYTGTAGVATLPAGVTSTEIVVPVNNDAEYGGAASKAFTLTLSDSTNAPIAQAVGTGTITENDAFGGVHYVDIDAGAGAGYGSSWANAFTNLQAASLLATSGDEIWVAAGTYKGDTTNDFVRLASGVELYGGFTGTESLLSERIDPTASPTIISGDLDGDGDNTIGVDAPKLLGIVGDNVVVDGFIFEYALANESYGVSGSENGAGCIRVNADGPITIRNNTFRYCRGDYGINIVSYGSYSGDLVIENSLFTTNQFYDDSSCVMYLRGGHDVYLRNSVVYNNNGGGEGSVQLRTGTITFENSVMVENGAPGNATGPVSSGFKNNGGTFVGAWNCVFTNGWEDYFSSGNTANVYVNPTNGAIGFVDEETADFRLLGGSPLINAGDNTRATATDIRGTARPQDGTVDIGIYEMNPFYDVTLRTTPAPDLEVSLNGDAQTAPYTYTSEGTGQLAVETPQTNLAGNIRYHFSEWTNDVPVNVSTDNPYSLLLTADTNFTAVFTVQVQATNTISGFGTIDMSPADGWVTPGGSVTYANPVPGAFSSFDHWEDDTGSDLGATVPLVLTVNHPTNVVAVFEASGGEEVTVLTSPADAGFWVETMEYFSSALFNWGDTSTHLIGVTNPVQRDAGTQYRFVNWDDGLNGPVATTNWAYEVFAPGPYVVTATFDTFYKLTKGVGNGVITNHVTVGDDYYASGATLYLYPVPDPGYVFVEWTGDGSGSTVPLEVTMNAAKSVSATYKQVIFVKHDAAGAGDGSSWGDAYTSIHAAIAGEPAGSEFWVAAGSYFTPTTSSAISVRNGDELYGGFAGTESVRAQRDIQANETVITGDTDNNDISDMAGNAPLMTSSGDNSAYATVDGFTFRYGKWDVSGAQYGGAISRPTSGAAYRIRNSIFRDNTADYGGAIGIGSGNQSTIENCLFFDNTAVGGPYGGAIYQRRGNNSTLIMNSTFFGNSAGGSVDDVFRHVSASMTIQNSILWSSEASIDHAVNPPTVSYSNVRKASGTVPGSGNQNADPLFVDAGGRDFRLQSTSPALDAGSNSGAPAVDIRQVVRPQNGTTDIGAYEMVQFTTAHMSAVPGDTNLVVSVGGVAKFVPNTYTVEVGSVDLQLDTPQTFGVVRYVFNHWTNALAADGSDANPFSYTATAASTNWQALFATQFQVQVSTNPASGAGVASVEDWVTDGAQATFSATPHVGWGFSHWLENTGGSTVSSANPYLPTITTATNLTAVFTCTGVSVTLDSEPAGATLSVDGTDIVGPLTYCWVASASHALSAVDVFADGATNEYRFSDWSDTQAQSEPTTNWTYTVPGVDATVTANYDTYYKLDVTFNAGGTVTTNTPMADGFHLSGSSVDLTATPDAGYVFEGWSGDASGTTSPLTVTMTAARSITATFRRIYFVDADATGANDGMSWADAYPTLSAALTAAPAGSEFWVAGGTYYPPTTSSPLTLENADAIYGGFAGNESTRTARDPAVNETIISGDSVGGDDVSDMVGSCALLTSVANNSAYCEVDGFTFEHGKFTSGAGYGGAITKGNPGGAFRVRRSIFRNNTAVGGGAFGYASNGNGNGTTTLIENCLFHDNTATSAANGGAIYARRGGNLAIVNSTFMNNVSGGSIDDVYRHASATLTIQNSILWSSTSPITSGSGTQVSYSDVRQPAVPFPGTGNLNSDPLFVDSGSNDFRLSTGSPAEDTGSATGAPADDLLGVARPINALWDMGAYEGTVGVLVEPRTIIMFK